jgi:plastocyanin
VSVRRPFLPALLVTSALVLAACGSDAAAPAVIPEGAGEPVADPIVEVDDNVFVPESITVTAGTEVRWEWVGGAAHNVVGDDFESEIQVEGEFTHTFDEPGTYEYVCTLHPGMDGEVLVVPAG